MKEASASKPTQLIILSVMGFFLISLVGLWLWTNKNNTKPVDEMVWIPGGEFAMGSLNSDDNHPKKVRPTLL
jgi:formylglycine-generating enzyme required for sulfatase activity